MDAPGRQRVAMNEATFRKINEGMEAGQDPYGRLAFLCECGRLGCNQLLRMTRAEYEALRANPRRFAIVEGHELPEVEDVVDRAERFIVVEKRGHPEAEVVEHTDPRQPLEDYTKP
jgi:predicted ThiF/HesA family dinucleotide-utilizing enzyme